MVILGEPDDLFSYYMADGELAYQLHKAGFPPAYKGEDGTLYFKKSKKLVKYLVKIGIED